jgi:hypothetical protein
MMHRHFAIAVATLLLAQSAAADIVPGRPAKRPDPPPPPSTALIRGITVGYEYGYWKGNGWHVAITACAAETAACKGRNVVGCLVVLSDGSAPVIPDLVAQDKLAGSGPLKLKLERCSADSGGPDLVL